MFKAKYIRDSMNLINSDNFGVEKIAKQDYTYAKRQRN